VAKQSQAWKTHERETARYFGTQRRLRGADFSQSDVEVLVNVPEWLYGTAISQGPLIVVECKYSSQAGIVSDFKDLTSGHTDKTPIVILEDYILLRLNDFKEVYHDFIENQHYTALEALFTYEFIHSSKKAPNYLKGYRDQSLDYTKDLKEPALPIVCLAKNRVKGKVAIINRADLDKFRSQLLPKGLMP
jgi:hypothetical protein